MKKFVFAFLAFFAVSIVLVGGISARRQIPANATREEKAGMCCGRIRVVSSSSNSDFRVRVVDGYGSADLRVRLVNDGTPPSPGNWAFVETSEDWSVCFVDGGEDFSVYFSPF
ncbi:MAG: hypothetical protein K6B46_03685 [Opitutales bacterium]|nr:hypothetical protein [Opitutales bacterium]